MPGERSSDSRDGELELIKDSDKIFVMTTGGGNL
jgi:hypothetical protein